MKSVYCSKANYILPDLVIFCYTEKTNLHVAQYHPGQPVKTAVMLIGLTVTRSLNNHRILFNRVVCEAVFIGYR